jgi:RNA polymerase sigma factor (sigma-70 family)
MANGPVVFVVDDDPAMQESLRWLIESVGLEVRTFSSAAEFLDAYEPEQPGCLLTDVRMPQMSGLDLQERLSAMNAALPVVMITGYGDVSMAVRAMKRGAADFIEKPFNDQELLDRIQRAVDQDTRSRTQLRERQEVLERMQRLTPREREVMSEVVAGKSNKQIAVELGLSDRTVEVHRANIMTKLAVKGVAELVRAAMLCQNDGHA